jgi:hypothetical protein
MAERSIATELSDTSFDEARVEAYELTDAEMGKLDKLAASFFAKLQRTFGDRTLQVVVNMLGSVLSHTIASVEAPGGDESFYVVEAVNGWLHAAHLNHRTAPWQIVIKPCDYADKSDEAAPLARVS